MIRQIPTVALLSALAGCGSPGSQSSSALRTACGAKETYTALKEIVFEESRKEFDGDIKYINTLESGFDVKVDDPVSLSVREDIQRAECKGRMILAIPAAYYEQFGRDRNLIEDVTYSVQAAADGKGYVYELGGFSTTLQRINVAASTLAEKERAAIERQQAALTNEREKSVPKPRPQADDESSGNLIN